jgi:hypothetical protein
LPGYLILRGTLIAIANAEMGTTKIFRDDLHKRQINKSHARSVIAIIEIEKRVSSSSAVFL